MVVNIAYDYRIIIIIREYEIFTEYKIHMHYLSKKKKYTCIVCLGPGRGIDRHAYWNTVAVAYSLQISRPYLDR